MSGYWARSASKVERDTIGFIKKLPAFPSSLGSGSLLFLISIITSRSCDSVGTSIPFSAKTALILP